MVLSTGRVHLGIFVGVVVLWLLLSCNFSSGVESDINCLKSIYHSLEDPLGYLNSSWDFSNRTEGFICNFLGIECWHPHENKVLNIKLSDLGLRGPFPRGIENCTSLTGLDLSSNKLNGSIPHDISSINTYLTTLDLSSNSFSGPIPSSLGNCSYLNVLKLENNQLEGNIPKELGQLPRIKSFSVANNRLTGSVPNFAGNNTSIHADSYANNPGLCGGPMMKCQSSPKKSVSIVRVLKSHSVLMLAALGFGIGFSSSFTFFVNSKISQCASDRILRSTYYS